MVGENKCQCTPLRYEMGSSTSSQASTSQRLIMVKSMEDNEGVSMFDDEFLEDNTNKASNDPWTTTQNESPPFPALNTVPVDPLRDFIDSEKYIESLEKKLSRVKGKQKHTLSAKEMITSLQQTKETQFEHVLAGRTTDLFYDEESTNGDTMIAALQRKINPDRQAINAQELLPLVKEDVLAKSSEIDDSSDEQMKTDR